MKLVCVEITPQEYKNFYRILCDRWEVFDNFYVTPPVIGKVDNLFVFLDERTNNIVGFFSLYKKWAHEDRLYSSVYVLAEYRGLGVMSYMYHTVLHELDYEYVFAIVDKCNKVSARAHNKIGIVFHENKRLGKTTYLIER